MSKVSGYYSINQLYGMGWDKRLIESLLSSCPITKTNGNSVLYDAYFVDEIKSANLELFINPNARRNSKKKRSIFFSDFYKFRKSIRNITNLVTNLSQSNTSPNIIAKTIYVNNVTKYHNHLPSIDSDITLKELIFRSIGHYNEFKKSNDPMIRIADEDLDSMVLQYDTIDIYIKNQRLDSIDDKTKCICIQYHDVTIFFTFLIMMYLYNDYYKKHIKNLDKEHNIHRNTYFVSIYKRLIEKCAIFDNIPFLKKALKVTEKNSCLTSDDMV